jgi:hypothetical protein
MRQAVIGWLLGGLSLLAVLGCEPPADTRSHGGPVVDHVSFVDSVRGAGYAVEIMGEVQQPFLSVAGTVLRVRGPGLEQGEEVQSYGYESVEAAKADASAIGPDGSVPGMKISWIGPPHFFLRERVLVIYVGANPHMMRLLSGLMGSQFAGQPAS